MENTGPYDLSMKLILLAIYFATLTYLRKPSWPEASFSTCKQSSESTFQTNMPTCITDILAMNYIHCKSNIIKTLKICKETQFTKCVKY